MDKYGTQNSDVRYEIIKVVLKAILIDLNTTSGKLREQVPYRRGVGRDFCGRTPPK